MDYAEALRFLRGRIERDGHLVGVAAGSGITAKYAVAGGCDLVLALSSGKYRQMGCSSMAGFLCYANSNDLVMDYALRELMRPCAGVPLLFGLNASDPTRAMYDYIREIKRMGFTGVVNYPTAGMIDGRFRAALEAEGFSLTVLPFRTTAENLARYVCDRLTEQGFPVSQVDLYETPNNCAIYRRTA